MNGILFKSEMTLANLNGLKNRTSRTRGLKKINENPDEWELVAVFQDGKARFYNKQTQEDITLKCPYKGFNSELYGKETWRIGNLADANDDDFYIGVDYRAGGYLRQDVDESTYMKYFEPNFSPSEYDPWKSPMMMPEWASRYHIILDKIIAQRIQEITPEDCIKEGIQKVGTNQNGIDYYQDYSKTSIGGWLLPYVSFISLWDSINGKTYPWSKNCWVWGLYYRVVKKEGK